MTRKNKQHEKWLLELTGIPTAAGCEHRVIDWVKRWARKRPSIFVRPDQFGNLELRRRGSRSTRPIYFVAHMDHPAFVVTQLKPSDRVAAEFRGGVRKEYFTNAKVIAHGSNGLTRKGLVSRRLAQQHPDHACGDQYEIHFKPQAAGVSVGDVITWDLTEPHICGDHLYTAAADNLASVAAALSAFGETSKPSSVNTRDVRVLLTRCEEIGFVGAFAAASNNTLPKEAELIVLENSKSFSDSPIGAGPIIRVGDRLSTFSPHLTYQLSQIAGEVQAKDKNFKWQRRLMPGGACEATAFQTCGYDTACICLPLGNYHNMNEQNRRIAPETISVSDYHGLIRLLCVISSQARRRSDDMILKSALARNFNRHKTKLI